MTKKLVKILYLFILILLSIVCLLMSNKINITYKYIWLWPVAYTVMYILIFFNLGIKQHHKIAINFIIYVYFFVKYVIYPTFISFTNSSYIGTQHIFVEKELIYKASFLAIYELIFASIFIYLLEKVKIKEQKNSIDNSSLYIGGNKNIYKLYIFISIFVYLILGRKYNVIRFFSISSIEEINNPYIVLIKYIVIIGIVLTVLLSFDYCKVKYDSSQKYRYVIISLFIALFYTSLIQGKSRYNQIYVAFIMIAILSSMFPKYRKKFMFYIGSVLLSVILIITSFRTGKTLELVSSFEKASSMLQTYMGGPVSIAQSIKVFTQFKDVNMYNFIFDFLRSIFGLNFLFKDKGYTISQMYNLFLYSGKLLNGQLVFSTSYGYIFLGVLGVPLIICLNIGLCCFFNRKFKEAKSYEAKYLYGYSMFRILTGLYINTPSFLAKLTQYIFMFGIVFLCGKFFKNNESNSKSEVN